MNSIHRSVGSVIILICMACGAQAADQAFQDARKESNKAVKLKASPKAEKPFFTVNDNRITLSQFSGAVAGYSAKTLASTFAFTHFDAWKYGTNSFSLLRSSFDHTVPTAPCLGAVSFPVGQCASPALYLLSLRSTLGWNELFDTKAFSTGPLTNISFLAGADVGLGNNTASYTQNAVVAGLQFGFGLPYKGYLNVSPLYSQRRIFQANYLSPSVAGALGVASPYVGLPDGVRHFSPTWGVDLNYYMDLGFLPETLQYFAISGRATIRGADGTGGYGPYVQNPRTARTVGYATEPVRLTFDAGKLFWGQPYSHLVDIWAAWRYDYNIGGYNVAADPSCVNAAGYNGSCSDSGVYYGMTIKLGADVPGNQSLTPFGVPLIKSADNTLTYGILPNATSPGETAQTQKQVYAFTHSDSWAYGSNLVYADVIKSDHRDPSSPCSSVFNSPAFGVSGPCAGVVETNLKLRSTLGFNETFNTTAFRMGPLRDVSFEIGADGRTTTGYWAPNKKAVVAGLQFAFDLPYRGYLNIAPLYYQEWNHWIYAYPNNAGNTPFGFIYGSPRYTGIMPAGFTGTIDGNLHYQPTWALEMDYGQELGFLPESLRYFSWSGHVGVYGAKGNGAYGAYTLPSTWNSKIEINAEPVRLSFDLSKALWGEKYSHYLESFVAYRYWRNKFGLDDGNPANGVCYSPSGSNNKSCTEQTVFAGLTSKF